MMMSALQLKTKHASRLDISRRKLWYQMQKISLRIERKKNEDKIFMISLAFDICLHMPRQLFARVMFLMTFQCRYSACSCVINGCHARIEMLELEQFKEIKSFLLS